MLKRTFPHIFKVMSVFSIQSCNKRFILARRDSYFSPSGKIILNTKKKITIETPPVINVTKIL